MTLKIYFDLEKFKEIVKKRITNRSTMDAKYSIGPFAGVIRIEPVSYDVFIASFNIDKIPFQITAELNTRNSTNEPSWWDTGLHMGPVAKFLLNLHMKELLSVHFGLSEFARALTGPKTAAISAQFLFRHGEPVPIEIIPTMLTKTHALFTIGYPKFQYEFTVKYDGKLENSPRWIPIEDGKETFLRLERAVQVS